MAPTRNQLQHFSSRAKDIYIRLHDYALYHSPSSSNRDDTGDNRFIGRLKQLERLERALESNKTESGTYLVTGFRGMGKTSLVRKSIATVRRNIAKKVIVLSIEISLARDDMQDIDILRQLVREIHRKYREFLSPELQPQAADRVRWYAKRDWSQWGLRLWGFICASLPVAVALWWTLHKAVLGWSIPYQSFSDGVGPMEYNLTALSWGILSTLFITSTALVLSWIAWRTFPELEYQWRRRKHFREIYRDRNYKYYTLARNHTPKAILRDLAFLNDRTHSSVSVDQTKEGNLKWISSALQFVRKKSKSYPIASAKEIESELIAILHRIQKAHQPQPKSIDHNLPSDKQPPISGDPNAKGVRFVIVFDELDKIGLHQNQYINDKEADSPSPPTDNPSWHSTQGMRKRQEALGSLLANLKQFLNVAQAKFVFIAGREIFDASLADISDRESFFGSIFHDVIYVPSFYKDRLDKHATGITHMTEAYLCQFLHPDKKFRDATKKNTEQLNLKAYFDAIRQHTTNSVEAEGSTGQSSPGDWKKEEREKVAFMLQTFIIFLTYRSNGSPKKLTSLLEKYLYKAPSNKEDSAFHQPTGSDIIFPPTDTGELADSYYLHFGVNDQYLMGLTSTLFRPFLIAHSSSLKALGDKLLISTSYLIDHLFKFHQFGFSWRNLELTPEIIAFNKAPELRKFLNDLIHFLSGAHLRETPYGLFRYKFFKKVTNEIRYASKISEQESAAFNFTLDESLPIKRHYQRKIQEQRNTYKDYKAKGNHPDYVHSIGYMSSILGDLCFYDQEFDEAIVHYSNALQHLRNGEQKQLSDHQFLIYLRDKLKLGLTLEKINAFDSGMLVFGELMAEVVDYFGEPRAWENWINFSHGEVRTNLKKSWFHNLNTTILPFVAHLHLTEKNSIGGITMLDVQSNFRAFDRLHKKMTIELSAKDSDGRKEKVSTLKAIYHFHVGNILFFKNGTLAGYSEQANPDTPNESTTAAMLKRLRSEVDKLGATKRNYKLPFSALLQYWKSLQGIIRITEGFEYLEQRISCLPSTKNVPILEELDTIQRFLEEPHRYSVNQTIWVLVGSLISKIGDALLSTIGPAPSNKIDWDFLYDVICYAYNPTETASDLPDIVPSVPNPIGASLQAAIANMPGLFSMEVVLYCYKLSSLYYRKAGRHSSSSLLLQKVLLVVKDYENTGQPSLLQQDTEGRLTIIEQNLIEDILKQTYWASESTGRPQILKYESMLGYEPFTTPNENTRRLYNNITVSASTREPILAFCELKLSEYINRWEQHKKVLLEYETGAPVDLETGEYETGAPVDLETGEYETGAPVELETGEYETEAPVELETGEYETGAPVELETGEYETGATKASNYPKHPFSLAQTIVSPNSLSNSKFIRILELRWKAKLNWSYFVRFGMDTPVAAVEKSRRQQAAKAPAQSLSSIASDAEEHFVKISSEIEKEGGKGCNPWQLMEFLITDSIYCLMEVVKTLNIYGISYMYNHSYAGGVRAHLGYWCNAYQSFLKLLALHPELNALETGDAAPLLAAYNTDNNISPDSKDPLGMTEIVGRSAMTYLDHKFHYEKAAEHYHRAIQMHNEGAAYRTNLHNMYYLEDDFYDNLYHFCAAMERYQINTGQLRQKIARLEKKLGKSKLHMFKSYV